jgi:anti-anti-sigma factor
MDIKTIRKDNSLLVNMQGRMDAGMAGEFDLAFDKMIQEGNKNFVLDMSALEYISSAGLRSILGTYKKIKGAGGTLLLCGLGGVVKEVFEISGFASIFDICDTQAGALAKCPKA